MSTIAFARPPIPAVVSQHVEEAAHLRHVRSVLVRAPHVKLHQLGRLDERIAAHLDGIAVAGDYGLRLCTEALASPGAGEVFALAVRALELRDPARLLKLFDLAEVEPAAERGLISAFGWVSAPLLQGTIRALLAAPSPALRRVALAACAMHRVDPGPALDAALQSDDAGLRERAWRVAGASTRVDRLGALEAAVAAPIEPGKGAADRGDPTWRAAQAAVLLGSRGAALHQLLVASDAATPAGDLAAELALRVVELPQAQAHLRGWAARAAEPTPVGVAAKRRLIRRCGVVGDPQVVPWLIAQMEDLRWSRLAGEAFTLITGADLAWLDLERKPPEDGDNGRYGGPTEEAADDDVALDEDESLPWPDVAKVQTWWARQAARFPAGRRFFMGSAPSPAEAVRVLREGCQRQRHAAALWACVLEPGCGLFPTAAPAWRQKRWLAAAG